MRYVSTRDNSKEYSFEEVFIKGLADDGGLYVPTSLKKFSSDELSKLKNLKGEQINEILKKIIKVANLTRVGFANGDISTLMSPRTVISWGQNFKIF